MTSALEKLFVSEQESLLSDLSCHKSLSSEPVNELFISKQIVSAANYCSCQFSSFRSTWQIRSTWWIRL